MITLDTIKARHSVRQYRNDGITAEEQSALQSKIDEVSAKSQLNIQLVTDNPQVFDVVANFGVIHGCSTSIAFVTEVKAWRQVDLGIVRYNFEVAANQLDADWEWEKPLH